MTLLLAFAAATALSPGAEVKAIRIAQLESRAALFVEMSSPVAVAVDVREGPMILLRIPARAPQTLAVPQIEPPIERLRLTREGDGTLLSLLLEPGAPFETRHEPARLTVLFGTAGKAGTTAITPDIYARLFPSGPPMTQAAEPPAADERLRGGLNLGRIAVTPALSATWIDADVTFDSPQPRRNRYLQVQPGVTLATPLLAGQLALNYEPRLRFLSNHEALERTSHVAGAKLALPIGSRISSRAGYTFTRALLEANVVDPGREYFYDLAPFSFHDFDATLEFALASRLYLVADGALTRSRFDQAGNAGFFDYDRRLIGAGLGYDLRPDLRVDVTYSYDRVPPPPERDVAETSGHGVTADFRGALGPLTTGTLQVGYRSQTSPAAAGASASWGGLVAGASLRRELGRSTSVELAANRATRLSGFETNAYYLSNSATLALTLPLALQVSARGSVQCLHNDYPDRATAIGAPREDEIVGWTAGLGRDLGRRAWLRLDYRREQRTSNLPGFDVTTYGFMAQVGLRLGSGAGTGAGTP